MTKCGAVREGLRGDPLHQASSNKLESPRGGNLGSRRPCRSPRSAGAWGSRTVSRRLGVRAAQPRRLQANDPIRAAGMARQAGNAVKSSGGVPPLEEPMKVAVINFSGNTGKSMLTKNMLIPLLPGAKRISIEDLNDPGGRSDATITASMFPSLAAELNAFEEDKHFVLDIGASSAKEMVGHFARLATTRSDIDV